MSAVSALTQAELERARYALDARLRATKSGTPERLDALFACAAWEIAIALPQSTHAQRTSRHTEIAAIAAVADTTVEVRS